LKLENYTVQQGDSLIKVVKGRYRLKDEQINEAYLQILAKLNPDIENLDRILPGPDGQAPHLHASDCQDAGQARKAVPASGNRSDFSCSPFRSA